MVGQQQADDPGLGHGHQIHQHEVERRMVQCALAVLEDEDSGQYKGRDHARDVGQHDGSRESHPLVVEDPAAEVHGCSQTPRDEEHHELTRLERANHDVASRAIWRPKPMLSEMPLSSG